MRRRNIPHRKISIHALCEEGDSFSFSNRPVFSSFLSTPSARRATSWTMLIKPCWGNFYPRPLRGGRRHGQCLSNPAGAISIHALCEEGDSRRCRCCRSRPISIHALCEEGDGVNPYSGLAGFLFLSTPSARRATLSSSTLKPFCFRFLSTPSARRATPEKATVLRSLKFLSTPSARRATVFVGVPEEALGISIHALCEEGDLCCTLPSCSL